MEWEIQFFFLNFSGATEIQGLLWTLLRFGCGRLERCCLFCFLLLFLIRFLWMDILVVAEEMLGAWSDIGGSGTIRVAGLVAYLSFWREFYAIVFEDQDL
jgi:hypothetical protein